MFQTIVVGTDGSGPAHDAVRAAGELAVQSGADRVHVVTACDPLSYVELREIERSLPPEFQGLVDAHLPAGARFDAAADILTPMHVKPEEHERSGDPTEAILDVAETVGADLIVVGARGLGALGRLFRGSVSTKLVHHARCSVLVVEPAP